MANETSEFLDALYNEAAKEGESPTETAQRVSKNLRGVSRRELLGGAGAVGLGGLLGAGSMGATGTASADASTSDSDGNVGTPGDPVDGFFDGANFYDGANNQIGSLDENGLDIPSVSTDNLSGTYPGKVRAFGDGEVLTTIDPTETTTPVQDAVGVINNQSNEQGGIELPPARITEAGTVTGATGISILGTPGESVIEFTDLSANGFDIPNVSQPHAATLWHGFTLDGGSLADRTGGSAMNWTGIERSFNVGYLKFENWGGPDPVVRVVDGKWHTAIAVMLDFGFSANEGQNLVINAGGSPPLKIGAMACGSADQQNALNRIGAAHVVHIGQMNLGGINDGRALLADGDSVRLGYLNFEPTTSNGNWPVVEIIGDGEAQIGTIHLSGEANVTSCVELGVNSGNKHIVKPAASEGTVGTNLVEVSATPSDASYYYGPASDITDSSDSSTGLVRSLATAGTGNA